MRRFTAFAPLLLVAGCIFDAPQDVVTDSAAASGVAVSGTTDFYDIVYVADATHLKVYEGGQLNAQTSVSGIVALAEDPTLEGTAWTLRSNGTVARYWWNGAKDYGTQDDLTNHTACDLAVDADGTPWITAFDGSQGWLISPDSTASLGAMAACPSVAADADGVVTLSGMDLSTGGGFTYVNEDVQVADGLAFAHGMLGSTPIVEVVDLATGATVAVEALDMAVADLDTVVDSQGTWLVVLGDDASAPVQRLPVVN